jgi:glycosyltransferase involved in cell wall biosynthesis
MLNKAKSPLLYLITNADLGGAQTHIYELIRNFQTDYTIHIAVGCEGPLTQILKGLDITIHVLPSIKRAIRPIQDGKAVLDCIQLIRKVRPQFIHAHSSKAGIIARVAGYLCRVPVIFTAHGWGFTPGAPRIRRLIALYAERMLAPLTTRIICVSESDRQLALEYKVAHAHSLLTIHNGIEDQILLDSQDDMLLMPLRLIMTARFNEQKDQATLLRAVSYLKQYEIHLDLVGAGSSLSQCQELAEDLGITDQVTFWGSRSDILERLSQAHIFVLTTHYEGLPISILEAMRSGLPIVATAVNGIPETVEPHTTGYLVPPQDVDTLKVILEKLILSPELRQRMGKASRQKFLQQFTLDAMLEKTRLVYQEITEISSQ